jgi:hypothetical protein
VGAYAVHLDRSSSLWEFDFFFFDDQVGAEDATSYLATVLAVTDMTSALFAEEIIIIDFDGDSLAETRSFHVRLLPRYEC